MRYDPLYRLIAATGREHIDQSALCFAPKDGNYRDFPQVGAGNLLDLKSLRKYVERYDYTSQLQSQNQASSLPENWIQSKSSVKRPFALVTGRATSET